MATDTKTWKKNTSFSNEHKVSNVYNIVKERACHINVPESVRDIMKSKARKVQKFSDYILELIQYKEEHSTQ
jgi:alcohol dehydrogenase YqhD (iron-dependent ADH family)